MTNKLSIYLLLTIILLATQAINAQDSNLDKEFYKFQLQQEYEFHEFKTKANSEFEMFLRETWVKFEALPPEQILNRHKPFQQPSLDIILHLQTPIEVNPFVIPLVNKPDPSLFVPEDSYISISTEESVILKTENTEVRNIINFYGTSLSITTNAVKDLSLIGTKECDVANAWKRMCKSSYEQLINDCLNIRDKIKLNDWGFVQLTKKIAEQIYGKEKKNHIAFLQMFILNNSGYKSRLVRINNQFKLTIATIATIYGLPFIIIDGNKYYICDTDGINSSMDVYTYKHDFANAKNYISLDFNQIPDLEM